MSSWLPFQHNKCLKEVSTFAIGGKAKFFISVTSVEEMQKVLSFCHEEGLPFFILGKGSNCLFDDRGINGVVIQNKISYLVQEDKEIDVGAGYSFSMLGLKTAKEGFSGLEFASGIPASVGGAIFMNAGANGQETSTYLTSVSFVDEYGKLHCFSKQELLFTYRFSSLQQKKGAIVSARFTLVPAAEAREKQISLINYRTKTQPTQEASAGCVFKNPEGFSAGALIEKAGLKGFSIGGAEVSVKHANFIVNRVDASAKDVLDLVEEVTRRVELATGVRLEREIRCIPYEI